MTLYRPAPSSTGHIPEIIPRRVFFGLLEHLNQKDMINFCKPLQETAVWNNNGKVRTISLTSDKNFFVYDKYRMAEYLFMHAGKNIRTSEKVVKSVAELAGHTCIYDCRGSRAVLQDAAYRIDETTESRTACRYLISNSAGEATDTVMRFWTDAGKNVRARTWFRIPVSRNKVSFGCSTSPSDPVSEEELLAFFDIQDLPVNKSSILYRGFVTPNTNIFRCNLPPVISLGDAHRSPCPLTEYGTLAALKQTATLSGKIITAGLNVSRQLHDVIDPHLPVELFYE